MPAKVGIITTLRDASDVLDSFLTYHFAIGFSKIFLFFDDPSDPAIELAGDFPDAVVVRNDQKLRQAWETTLAYQQDDVVPLWLASERQVRMRLNLEVGIAMARAHGLDWVLGIDSDELFHCAGKSVPQHFGDLSEQGLYTALYRNHEGVPERADITDFFREVTLFKSAIVHRDGLTAEQRECIGGLTQFATGFYNFYGNGKAAARLDKRPFPQGVHRFIFPGEGKQAHSLSDLQEPAPERQRVFEEPAILHYPCCGFDHFRDKFRALGDFPDRLYGIYDIRSTEGPFAIDSREAFRRGDDDAKQLFDERLLFSDPSQTKRLIDSGALFRMNDAAKLLADSAPKGRANLGPAP